MQLGTYALALGTEGSPSVVLPAVMVLSQLRNSVVIIIVTSLCCNIPFDFWIGRLSFSFEGGRTIIQPGTKF